MSETRSARPGGYAALVAGLCVAVILVLNRVWEPIWALSLLAAFLLIVAVWGMRRANAGRDGWAGTLGAWLVSVGGGALTAFGAMGLFAEEVLAADPEEIYPSWLEAGFPIGALLLLLGLLFFGIASMVVGELPRIPILLLLLFLPVGIGIDIAAGAMEEEEGGIGFYIGFSMLAVGLLWLGFHLLSKSARKQEPTRAA